MMRVSALLLIPFLVLCGSAYAVEGQERASLAVTTNSVGTPTYDLSGRLVGMETKRFDSDGDYTGSHSFRYVHDARGRIAESSYVSADAEDLVMQSMQATWEFDLPGICRQGKRIWLDGWDEMQRWEKIVWRNDPNAPIQTRQTEYFDGDDELVKTRYSVTERDDRGRITVQDFSLFAPDNSQLSRTYERWFYVEHRPMRVKRVHFDEADEITSQVEVNRFYGRANRLVKLDTRTTNPKNELLTTSVEERTYDSSGKLVQRTILFADAQGVETRRYTESTSYDASGLLKARRSSWETLQ
jgi:hypothetical protein